MSQESETLFRWIDDNRDQMVESLQGILRIPSLKADAVGDLAPYGAANREALDFTLTLASGLGFTVKDVGGHAGHAEFGQGEEMVAAVGHLDVVPTGGQWMHPPFGAEIENGYVYARGASDDKGPTYAALFGAKAVMESGLPLSRRVRVIFGCDEESGFGCVKHYWEVACEERPVLGFTPDADFPMVYAEKGIANIVLEKPNSPSSDLRVVSASGGLRPNMVPENATARIEGAADSLAQAVVALDRHWDKNVTYEVDTTGITITAKGKSAHGATPELGVSAVASLGCALSALKLGDSLPWANWMWTSADCAGEVLGIVGRDDVAGPLTNNLGVMSVNQDKVRLTYNVRYPVTWNEGDLKARLQPVIDREGWTLAEFTNQDSLYVPLDTEPAKTLMRVYREETGDTTTQPFTMGGGTYARATPHTIAYGMAFPGGTDGPAHEPDERLSIENYIKGAKIYARALYELAK